MDTSFTGPPAPARVVSPLRYDGKHTFRSRWPTTLSHGHGLDHHGDYVALLLVGELGKHRERKHLGGCLLGNREIARTEAERIIGLREMKRDRVVDARSDARGSQILLKLLPVSDPNNVEVVNRSRPRGHVRQGDRAFGAAEELVI